MPDIQKINNKNIKEKTKKTSAPKNAAFLQKTIPKKLILNFKKDRVSEKKELTESDDLSRYYRQGEHRGLS